jgi:CrcB protein
MLREAYLALVVFLGAGLGGVLRHGVNRLVPLLIATPFPASTLLVNVTGSLVMGLLTGWFTFRGEQAGQELRLFLTTGILGGFTTFSTFSLDTAVLWERGQMLHAAGYALASVGVSLAAVFAGLALIRALLN